MTRSVQCKGNKITPELHIGLPPTSLKLTPDSFPKWRTKRCNIGLGYLATRWTWGGGRRNALGIWAKISFNIILLNLAGRIIAIFLLIDLFVFSSWWWMFDRYISIIDRKMSNTNEYFINRFTSIVWKNSIIRQISIIKIVMVAQQRACRPLRGRHGQIKRKSLYSRFVFSD